MAINWTDNKVFSPNAPQRIPTNDRTNVNNAPVRQAPVFPEDNMQMDKFVSPPSKMNDNMMDSRMNDNMMENRMMTEDQFMNDMMNRQGPPPVMNVEYIAGFLKQNIGRNVRAEFPLSSGFYIDKAGILREVGVNYFVLEDYISHARILCDLYSVKFVTIL